ncbi:MAG: PAS domain S-box protein, partial [Eudoraea sp.]|nr:PAS domain S-box protein [Eudoraea sp.]
MNNRNTLVGNYNRTVRVNPTITNNYLIKQLPVATAYLNRKLEVVYVSDKWIDDFDFSKRDVVGQKLDTLFEEINAEWKKVLKNCLMGKTSEKGLQHYTGNEEEEQWFEWVNIPWYDEKENVIGVIIQTEDVTHRIQNEVKIEKLEILLHEKSASTKIGSWEFEVAKNKLTWCNITKELHEVVQNYVPNIDTAINFYKEGFSRNSIAMAVDKAMETGQPWKETCQLITAKGREITVVAAGKPIFKGKKLIGLVGTFEDITNTIEKDTKNKQQERHFRSIFNSSYQFTGILDVNGTFLEVNETAQKFAGLAESDIIGKKFWNAYWWPVPDYVKDGLKQVVKA